MGELAAERYFLDHGWKMVRTQPAIQILGMKPGKVFGKIFTVRMIGRGGVPDYTGYRPIRCALQPDSHTIDIDFFPRYLACEVKEATGDTMPASRLDREQREFMAALPEGSAFVGVFWTEHQRFTMHRFREKGSYKLSEGSII